MKRILKIAIHKDFDESPDTSWIGKYASSYGYKDFSDDPAENKVIDRRERGDCGRGEYRYFIAANSGKDTGNLESVEQDYQRMESLNSGQWHFMGIWAEAEVQTGSDIVQTIRSGGLWGIESDSDWSYFAEVEREELSALKAELIALGFSERAIKSAFSKAIAA